MTCSDIFPLLFTILSSQINLHEMLRYDLLKVVILLNTLTLAAILWFYCDVFYSKMSYDFLKFARLGILYYILEEIRKF